MSIVKLWKTFIMFFKSKTSKFSFNILYSAFFILFLVPILYSLFFILNSNKPDSLTRELVNPLIINKVYAIEPTQQQLDQTASILSSIQSTINKLKTDIQSLFGREVKAQADITTGLVGYWKFDEGAGTTANDASGNNNTGALINGPTWTAGKIGGALSFDGVDDYVEVNPIDWSGPFTVSLWVKTITSKNNDDGIFSSSNNLFDASTIQIDIGSSMIQGCWGAYRFSMRHDGGGTLPPICIEIITLNQWKFLTVTFDGSMAQTYINGIFSGSYQIPSWGPFRGLFYLYRFGLGGNNIFFNGVIDDARIYNRALSSIEITELYNFGSGIPPLPDSTPPALSSGSPSGTLPAGTTQTTLSLTTDENATCKYGTISNTAYGSIANTFTITGGTSHSQTITGLTNGTSYNYYVRCQNTAGIANTTDYTISFSVATPTGDTIFPIVSITSPLNGATVSGTITISTNATDNVAVAGVQFKLDTTTNLGTEDTTSPYSYSLNTTTITDGSHTLIAVARDTSNNYTTSSIITITVNNASPPPPDITPPSIPTGLIATAISSSQINLSWTASTDNIGVTGYKIYRCAGSVCAPTAQIATSAVNSYSNTGLTPSTAYTYAVSAYNAAGNESGKSTQASVTTQAATLSSKIYKCNPSSDIPTNYKWDPMNFITLADGKLTPTPASWSTVIPNQEGQIVLDTFRNKKIAFVSGVTLEAPAGTENWEVLPVTNCPPAVWGGSLVYDSINKEGVLIGGTLSVNGGTEGTWIYSPQLTDWYKLNPSSIYVKEVRSNVDKIKTNLNKLRWDLWKAIEWKTSGRTSDVQPPAVLKNNLDLIKIDLQNNLTLANNNQSLVSIAYEKSQLQGAATWIQDAINKLSITGTDLSGGVSENMEKDYRVIINAYTSIENAEDSLLGEPQPRYFSTVAYDALQKAITLNGGKHNSHTWNDNWIYLVNEHRWERKNPLPGAPFSNSKINVIDSTGERVLRDAATVLDLKNNKSSMDSWTSSVPLNTWIKAPSHGTGRPNWGRSWSSIVYDPDRQQIYYRDGGHGSYHGSVTDHYDIPTGRWFRSAQLEGPDGTLMGTYFGWGRSYTFSPWAIHTYKYGLFYNPLIKQLQRIDIKSPYILDNSNGVPVNQYNPDTGMWAKDFSYIPPGDDPSITGYSFSSPLVPGVPDGLIGVHAFDRYNPRSTAYVWYKNSIGIKEWNNTGALPFPHEDSHSSFFFDPVRKRVMYYGGKAVERDVFVLDINLENPRWTKVNATVAGGGSLPYPSKEVVYIPKYDVFLMVEGWIDTYSDTRPPTIWSFDPKNNEFKKIDLSFGPGVVVGNGSDKLNPMGVSSGLAYDPISDLSFYISNALSAPTMFSFRYRPDNVSSDSIPPTTPINPIANAISSSQINLSWTASTDNVGVAGYKIYRGGTQIATSATNSYTDSGLSPSTTYSYTVSSYDAAGNGSGQSPSVSATTQADLAPGSLNVLLAIQESLPDDPTQPGFQLMTGVDRTQEPVTFGIPLPENSGLSSISQLGLSGVTIGQFRVLARWPNNNIKWVLVNTQADVSAQAQNTSISLIAGSGNFGGPNLAIDQGSTISVNTGPAQFTIKKIGFNLFNKVVVNGVELVSPGTSPGIILTGTDGTVYLASNDNNAQVFIEENGPARAVILAKGTHYSGQGQRNLDFTVRIHLYKGKTKARVFYTLRNASKEQAENAAFQSLELVVRSALSQPSFTVSNHTNETTGLLSTGSSIRLFHGENAFPNVRDDDFTEIVWPTTIPGYTIKKDNQILASGSRDQFINLFYAQAQAADGRTVTIGTRFAAGWWPQGLGIDADGTVHVGVFPVENNKPYYARFNSHVTREILFDFASKLDNARNTFFRFQYPLVGKAKDVDWYNQTGALWEKIISFTDEIAYYQSKGWPIKETQDRRPGFTIWRHKYWGEGGGLNQYDFTKVNLHDFLRQEANYSGGYFLNAEQRLAYNADLATHHTDDYHTARAYDEVPTLRGPYGSVKSYYDLVNSDKVPKAKAIFEGEHRHAYGMGFWYYFSGDERFRETYTDWGEVMQTQAGWNYWERGLAWNIYNLVDLYRFTGDPVYRDLSWKYLKEEVLDKTAVYKQSSGTDWQRGFFIPGGDAAADERSIAAFIKGAILPRAYAYFHDFAAADNLEADQAYDVLRGIVQFVADELWFEYSQNPGDFGFHYRISADSAPPQDVRLLDGWWGGLKEAYLTFVYGYLLTGDEEFLRKGELLQKATAYNTYSNYLFQDLPDRQTLQHLLQNREKYSIWASFPLQVQSNGFGSYTLSWTAPPNAKQYQIKYSDKPIVEWLGFDRTTRAYQYDPTQYTAFFAARNISNEPTPTPASSAQTFNLSGLSCGNNCYFAIKYLSGSVILLSPDTTPPIVSITSPASGQTVSGTITVSANATDNVGVSGVQFKLDNGNLGAEDTTSPYSISWNTVQTTNGTHTLTAVVRDSSGNRVTSSPIIITTNNDTTPPTISSVISTTLASTTARIDWQTTNELSTSQVEYGFTAQYGASTTLSTTLFTSHSVLLSNLSPDNTTYNFRVRSKDSSNNEAISINYSFITPGLTDIVPPASTTNLTANNITQTSVDLVTWTAAGDDGNSGTASSFDIRYSTGELSENTWNNGGVVRATGEPTPKPAGSIMNYTLVGLTPNTTYKVALKTLDEVPNQSLISNIITFTTLKAEVAQTTPQTTTPSSTTSSSSGGSSSGGGGGSYTISDTTPPPQITDLESDGADKQTRLTWNNPESSDWVRTIIVRKELTSATTTHATSTKDGQVIYEGTGSEFTDIKLKNNQTYYYSIFTIDRTPNYSSPATTTVQTIQGKTSLEQIKQPTPASLTGQGGERESKTIKPSFIIKKSFFKRNLKQGMKGEDVKKLQEVLYENKEEFYDVCKTDAMSNKIQNPKSKNKTENKIKCDKKELTTGYFGNLTKLALIRFQEKYKDDILKPIGLTSGTGFFGKTTIKKIEEMYEEKTESQIVNPKSQNANQDKTTKQLKSQTEDEQKAVREQKVKELKTQLQELIKQLMEKIREEMKGV